MAKSEFVRKSIGTLTLGEKLRKVRSEKRITLNEVSKNTKIQNKYLEFLENGEYDKLPSDVYVKGFLRSYAYYLGIEESILIKLYEREKNINKVIKKGNDREKPAKPIKLSTFAITPRMIFLLAVSLLVFLGFSYLYREANLFFSSPRLIILEPEDNSEVNEDLVKIEGISEKDSEVSINGQNVLVDEDGKFSGTLSLQSGINSIVIRSKNRFDKESAKTISINNSRKIEAENSAEEGINESGVNAEPNSKLMLEVLVSSDPTWISIEADGNLVFSGTLAPDIVKKFEAKEEFSISSGKGKSTHIKVNGEDRGVISESAGSVEKVIIKK